MKHGSSKHLVAPFPVFLIFHVIFLVSYFYFLLSCSRKLYTHSLSHASVPFFTYMRRKNTALRGSFGVRSNPTINNADHDPNTLANTMANYNAGFANSHSTQTSAFSSRSKSKSGDSYLDAFHPALQVNTNIGGKDGKSTEKKDSATPLIVGRKGSTVTMNDVKAADARKQSSSNIVTDVKNLNLITSSATNRKASLSNLNSNINKSKSTSITESAAFSPKTPSHRLTSLHNGMHNSMHGKKSISFNVTDIQKAAEAAAAYVNGLDTPNSPNSNSPFVARRRSALSTQSSYSFDAYAHLSEEQKKERMSTEVDEIIENFKEVHSLEAALKPKKSGKDLLNTLSASIYHSRSIF
jgi:hypothetical protein